MPESSDARGSRNANSREPLRSGLVARWSAVDLDRLRAACGGVLVDVEEARVARLVQSEPERDGGDRVAAVEGAGLRHAGERVQCDSVRGAVAGNRGADADAAEDRRLVVHLCEPERDLFASLLVDPN